MSRRTISLHQRILGPIAAVALGAVGIGTALVATAHADGPTTFSNTSAIAVPAAGSANQTGPASPYPSTVTVSGMAGPITTVTVALVAVTASALNDFDVMLVSPSGQNLVVLSDPGDPGDSAQLTTASNATFTFADSAAASFPQSGPVPTGTYRPTNIGSADPFPAPAPSPSISTTFAGAFTGIDPNGTWSLYVVDDTTGDVGSIAGGWSLTITTDVAALATTTTITTSDESSLTGAPITFTATVMAGGSPAALGTVQFAADGVDLGLPVAVAVDGTAGLTTSTLTERTHLIRATYSGAPGFLTSTGTVTQVVDNATVVAGNRYCNFGPIGIPNLGAASPYPSRVFVTGLVGPTADVEVQLLDVSHTAPIDLDLMLVAPSGTNLVLMSDAGGQNPAGPLDLTFSDAATSDVPAPLTSGTFRPTNADDTSSDAFPAPAPAAGAATSLSTFDGIDPNGTWSLYVVDDASGDSGSIAGGWCLTIDAAEPTTTIVTSAPNPSVAGQSVTVTATVTSGGSPVTLGTVQFEVDGTAVGSPVAVGADGTAILTTSTLAPGGRAIVAAYSGSAGLAPSSASISQNVEPLADAGGPYVVAEGDGLTLDGSASSSGGTYGWDLNGDGDFTDATGMSPTLSWAMLESLGIDDGPATHTIEIKATVNTLSQTAPAQLTITNTAPETVVTGDRTATAGSQFTIKVGADDPSSADMAAMFTYTVDWGDGSPITTIVGPSDPPVSHTYLAAGTYAAVFTATDKDGATSTNGATSPIQIVVAAPPTTTAPSTTAPATTAPSTTPPTTSPRSTTPMATATTSPPAPTAPIAGLPATGSNSPAVVLLAALCMLVGLAAFTIATRRPGTPR